MHQILIIGVCWPFVRSSLRWCFTHSPGKIPLVRGWLKPKHARSKNRRNRLSDVGFFSFRSQTFWHRAAVNKHSWPSLYGDDFVPM